MEKRKFRAGLRCRARPRISSMMKYDCGLWMKPECWAHLKKRRALEGVLMRRRVWKKVVCERGVRAERRASSRADQGLVLMSPAAVRAFLLLLRFAFWSLTFVSFGMRSEAGVIVEGLENKFLRLGGKIEVEYEMLNLLNGVLTFFDNIT